MKKKILSMLLVLTMCMTMLPAASFASDEEQTQPPVCSCEERCTAEQTDADCPVCSADDAIIEECCAPEEVIEDDAQQEQKDEEQPEGDNGPSDEAVNEDDPEASADNEAPEEPTEPSEEETPAEEEPVGMQAQPENGISVQAASGKFTLGGTEFDVSERFIAYGPDGGSCTYDGSTNTLTLENYKATGSHYYKTGSGQLSGMFKYYGVYIDARNIPTLNIVLKGDNYLGDSGNLKYISGTSKVDTPRTLGIWGNTVKFSGDGTLTIQSHVFPVQSGGIYVYDGATLNMIGQMSGSVTSQMAVQKGAVVKAECPGNNLDFYGLKVKGDLSIYSGSKVSVTSKGCSFNYSSGLSRPNALEVQGNLIVQDSELIVISDGSNGNDGCQGRAVQAKTLSLKNGGSLKAYSDGYNTSTKKYDGREAVYISKTVNIDAKSSLYARTLNPTTDNDEFWNHGAIRMDNGGVWNLENSDGYNNAVITKPITGYVTERDGYRTVYSGSNAYAAKEVEILGTGSAVLTLSIDTDSSSGKTEKKWRYRNYRDDSTEPGRFSYVNYESEDLDLKKGVSASFSRQMMPKDYQGFYGIDIQKGEHNVIMDSITAIRDHAYITVRNGATLNLKLTGYSYLENSTGGTAPVIEVESGGTLNIIKGGTGAPALTLNGSIKASSGSNVTVNDCNIYQKRGNIGGSGASVSLQKSWLKADFVGNLTVTESRVQGKHSSGTVKIDRVSNAELRDTSGKALTNVTDLGGNRVYQTVIKLENLSSNQNVNKESIIYRLDSGNSGTAALLPKIIKLRLKIGGSAVIFNDLDMLANSDEITLWLPEGAVTENVYGYNDGLIDIPDMSYIYEPVSTITTKSDNTTSGTMHLRSLIFGKGILALRGTVQNDNTQLRADYHDGDTTNWIDYDPAKDIKLQADTTATGFGIRVLQNGAAEIKLNALSLIGENKRVTVDNQASLTLQLYGKNSLRANGDDAVLNLTGSLTINGAEGDKTLTLGGVHAISGGNNASLTITDSTIISECSDKTTPAKLGSLKISNSNVRGLGLIDCDNIIIDGGSVDLSVPDGKIVKDSQGNILSKKNLEFDEKNSKVDEIVIDGLPDGVTFDDSNVITDGDGKINIWVPEGSKVTKVVIGDKVYYPKTDGSMGTSEMPHFTEPSADASRIIEQDRDVSFTAVADGSPAPTLQWQKSTDDGNTWSDIDGATNSEYTEKGGMRPELHGVKYRCVATNESGTVSSHTFTVYYQPGSVIVERSPENKMTFKAGESVDFTVKSYELKGVTEQYQWQRYLHASNVWKDIDGENGLSYHLDITDDMESKYYHCKFTLTYPNGVSKDIDSGLAIVQLVTKPVITEQPNDVTVITGKPAEFSVKRKGSYYDLSYQWQVSTDGGKNWTDIEGAGGEVRIPDNVPISYTLPATSLDMNGWQYRCVLTDDFDHVSVSTASEPATLTVLEKRKKDLNVTISGWTYGDAANAPKYDVQSGGASQITYAVKDGEEIGSSAPTNAGDYTVTVRYETDEEIYTGSSDFTISPKALTTDMIADIADQTYNGSALTPDLKITHGAAALEAGRDYTVAYDNNINAGKATATVTGKGNYQGSAVKEFTIRKAALTVDGTAAANAVYGTALKDIAISGLTVKLNNNEVKGEWSFSGDDVLPAGNTAGYAAIFTPALNAENYEELTLNIVPDISKKPVTVNAENKSTREGYELAELTYNFYPALIGSDAFTGSLATNADRNAAGTYNITQGTLALNDNYEITFNAGTYTVTEKLIQSDFRFEDGKLDNGAAPEKKYGDDDFTVKAVGAVEGSSVRYYSSNENVASVDDTGKVHITGAGSTVISAETSSTADYAKAEISYTLTVSKKTVEAPAADDTEFTYNGTEQTYTLTESSEYTISGNKQTAANESGHAVTVSLNDPANTRWAGAADDSADRTYLFVIKKATITITVINKTAYRSSAAPVLDNDSYTVEGLVNGEELAKLPEVKYVDENGNEIVPDMTKTGEIVIRAAGAAAQGADNYNIIYVDGKLTVVRRSSSGGGSSPSYYSINVGQTDNGTVTVDRKDALSGNTVTFTVTAADGCRLSYVTVTDNNGKEIKLTDNGNGKYTFTMPESAVNIKAAFVKESGSYDNPFVDVKESDYFYDAVIRANKDGIAKGVDATHFGPYISCTRAQAVTFMWRAAGSPSPKSASMPFTDVPAGSYYYDAVLWAVENGITNGVTDTIFDPDAKCTRAQIVTFMWRSQNAPASDAANPFTDVKDGAYYKDAVMWAVKNNITNGTSDNTFSPDADCTRAQIVTFIDRCQK